MTSTVGDAALACARTAVDRLSPAQRAGQLVMVGLPSSADPAALDATVAAQHVGGVVYLGGWHGATAVRHVSDHLQSLATPAATGGIPLLIAADQEGGAVQRIDGSGFSRIPSATAQGRLAAPTLEARADTWATQLAAAGVNVDLAPVAGTVPPGAHNAPLGHYHRQLGSDPRSVAEHVAALVQGLHDGGVEPTVKHFPGLGRVRENTDTSATGITDPVTGPADPFLVPFESGIAAGTRLVMVSLARYPSLDPANPAVFSAPIIGGLLRGRIGYAGVVISDDLDARALAAVRVQDRAVRFVEAGGDIALISRSGEARTVVAALLEHAAAAPAFAAALARSVERVVTLKVQMGLVACRGS